MRPTLTRLLKGQIHRAASTGYNATVFAYGQTGTGKTFTMTGGPERYEDRGIIPRTLQYLFAHFSRQVHTQVSCWISYLEIYNDVSITVSRRGYYRQLFTLARRAGLISWMNRRPQRRWKSCRKHVTLKPRYNADFTLACVTYRRVSILEDERGDIHLRGLSMHRALNNGVFLLSTSSVQCSGSVERGRTEFALPRRY